MNKETMNLVYPMRQLGRDAAVAMACIFFMACLVVGSDIYLYYLANHPSSIVRIEKAKEDKKIGKTIKELQGVVKELKLKEELRLKELKKLR